MQRQSIVAYGEPLRETEAPTPVPSGSEVVVRVTHCGVCHSDLHVHDGYFGLGGGRQLDVRAGRTLPFTLGHEIAGVAEAAGPEAGGVEIGRRYAVYPWTGCGTCRRCASGDEHLCERPHQLGITADGGYASHVVVPHPRHLIDIDGIAPEIAGSLMCSGITAYAALRKALPYLRGGALMIVGLGGVGMMALQLAPALTEARIVAADIDPAKRAAGLTAGASAVFDPAAEDARRTALKAVGAIDAAIDFVGAESSLQFAHGVTAKAGAVVVAGLMGGRFELPIPMFPLRQLAVLGTFVGSLPDARTVVELVRAGKVRPIPVACRPLAEANGALADLRNGKVVGRVVLTPP